MVRTIITCQEVLWWCTLKGVKYLPAIITGLLSAILFGVLFQAPISVWADVNMPNIALLIKAWKELLMGVAGVLLIIFAWRSGNLKTLLHDRMLWLIGAIALLHVVLLFAFDNHYVGELAALLIDLRIYLFFAEVYLLVTLWPPAKQKILIVAAAGFAVVMTFAVLQASVLPRDFLAQFGYSKQTIQPYLTVDLNPDYVRISSTLRGPNPLGALAVVVLSLLIAAAPRYVLKKHVRRPVYIAGFLFGGVSALVALWYSYSRSALGALLAAIIIVGSIWIVKKASLRVWFFVAALCVVLAGFGVWVTRDHHIVQNVVFHSNPTGGSQHKSDDGHIESLLHGAEAAAGQPLGAGLGGAGSASLLTEKPLIIENQYLYFAHESGWLGLVLQVWLFAWVLLLLWRRRMSEVPLGVLASGVGLAVIGLVLPVWVDDTVGLVWWGLAGAAITGYNGIQKEAYARTNHKKAKGTA